MNEHREAIRAARPRALNPGDKIVVRGLIYKVDRIYYQDVFLEFDEKHPDGYWCWMVEFIDSHEGYHYWKSQFDGGEVIYAEA